MASMICWLVVAFMFPVARENFFNPLGHSGQPRLQAVVGSMEMLTGMPA